MNSEYIIKEILKKNNFDNFKIKIINGNNKISRCDYNKAQTIIYIHKDDNKGDVNSLIIAAHEACHALNYSEGVTNHTLLLALQRVFRVLLLIMLTILIGDSFLSLFNIYQFPKFLIYTVIYLYCFFSVYFFIYYTRDEAKTEKRAIIELQKIWKENLTPIDFKDIQKRNKKTLYWSIYSITALTLPLLIVAPFLLHKFLNLFTTLFK